MAALVDDLLNLLRGHPLVKSVRVVNCDETPAGKLELKIRCRTAPHHFHDEHDEVGESPLSGKPRKDLKKVLTDIEQWISQSQRVTPPNR